MSIYEITPLDYSKKYRDGIGNIIQYVENIMDFGAGEVDEQELREKYESSIRAKLSAGKRLSSKEMQYLRKYNPALYAQVVRIEAKRQAVEERLKHAKSKKQVQEIQADALATISKNDSAREYMAAAVQEAVAEFKKTGEYKSLPEVEEKEKNVQSGKREHKSDNKKKDKEEEGLSITYEFSKGFYQMAYVDHAVSQNQMVR